MESKGKGYKKDKSMSVNASLAYLNGEMPKSKWTKAAIIEFLENEDLPDLAQKAPTWLDEGFQNRTRTLVTRTGLGSATSPLWSWWYSKPRSVRAML